MPESSPNPEMIEVPKEQLELLIAQNKEIKADMYTIVDQFNVVSGLFGKGKKVSMGDLFSLLTKKGGSNPIEEPIEKISQITNKYAAIRAHLKE